MSAYGSQPAPKPRSSAEAVSLVAQDSRRFSPRKHDLEDLANALRNGEDWDSPWSSVDLVAAFPASSTISIPAKTRRENLVGALAGTFVFVPVAWTWFSLREASEAYRAVLDDSPEDTRTFLQLWSSGFDGNLPAADKLSTMALVSLLLIAAAVAFILWHRWEIARFERIQNQEHAAAEAQLYQALTWATRDLANSRTEDPDQLVNLVKVSMRQLSTTHQQVHDAAIELQKAARETTDAAAKGHAAITVALSALQSAAADVSSGCKSLGANVASLSSSAAEVARQEAALVVASDRFGRATTSLGGSIGPVVAQAVAAGCQDLTTATKSLASATAGIETRLPTAVSNSVAGAVMPIPQSQTVLTAALQQMTDSVGRVEEALGAAATSTQSQISELTLARDALERLMKQQVQGMS